MSTKLLTRDEFREGVFTRDHHKCVICQAPAVDAHHIIERRLFTHPSQKGGYFLDNGVSVCSQHHIECEQTLISPAEVRTAAGITKIVLPQHLQDDEAYDKWGNVILANGQRLKGELFYDENVQKILNEGGVLNRFTHYVKYPRTLHLPWSDGITDDDCVHTSTDQFNGRRVIVTVKMDGENTTMYSDHVHARAIDSKSPVSRSWIKNYWSGLAHNIPAGWRLVGENLFATHSIAYKSLPSYFMGISIWNDKNWCLPWDETIEYFELLEIPPVSVLVDDFYENIDFKDLKLDYEIDEGYVVRVADGFSYGEFSKCVGKYVRPNHNKLSRHDRYAPVTRNGLR